MFRGNQLQVSAIVDVQSGQKQKIENARKALKDKHLFTVDGYAEMKEADIEDVLGAEFYVALVNNAYHLANPIAMAVASLKSSERIVPQIEAQFAKMPAYAPEFNHLHPAEYLFQQGDEGKDYSGFNKALERIEKLINDLNSLLK